MKNFKDYRDQTIELREGLTGIIGGNGAGKSSIFEAILLALYGEIPYKKEYLRTDSADEKEPVRVELELEISNLRYRILREFRGKSLAPQARIYDYRDECIATGQGDVTAMVEKLIGMGRDAFSRSIFSGQKDLGAISSSGGADRRELVRRMVGMDRIDEIQQLVREDRRRVKSELAGQETMLFGDDEIADKKQQLTLLEAEKKAQGEELAGIHERLGDAMTSYEKAKKWFAGQQEHYKRYNHVNTEFVRAKSAMEGAEKNLLENSNRLKELHSHQSEMELLAPREAGYEKVKKRKEEFDDLKNRALVLRGLVDQMRVCEADIAKMQSEVEKESVFVREHAAAGTEYKAVEKKLAEIEAAIEKANIEEHGLKAETGRLNGLIKERQQRLDAIRKLGSESACPTCLRPLKDAYEGTLAKLSDEIQIYQDGELRVCDEQLRNMKTYVQSLKESQRKTRDAIKTLAELVHRKEEKEKSIEKNMKIIRDKNAERERLRAKISNAGDISYNETEHEAAKKLLAEYEKDHERYVALAQAVTAIPAVREKIAGIRTDVARLTKHIVDCEASLKNIPYTEDAYRAAEKSQLDAETAKDRLLQMRDAKKEKLHGIETHAAGMAKELSDDAARRKKIDATRKEFASLQRLDTIMDGFKSAVLEKVRPVIAGYASGIFAELTQGRYEAIHVNDDFDFFILDNGEYYPIERFSGGEIDLANLCLRIAISRAIRDLSGGGAVGFLGFDEIFGSQDGERRREIIGAFHRLQEQYRQIFIISHIDEIKEEFPQIMEIVRTESGSSARWLSSDTG